MPLFSSDFSRSLRRLATTGLAAAGLLAGISQAQTPLPGGNTEVHTDQIQARLLAHAPAGVAAG